MQAIIFFVMFGMLSAVVGGIVGLTSESTINLIQRQVESQRQTFSDIATIITGLTVPENFESPGSSSTTNPAEYICGRPELRRVASCATQGLNLVMQDMWGRPVTGYQKRFATTAFSGTTSGGVFSVQGPVTAYVLVSAGPDGLIDGRLQADLNSLGSSSTLNSIIRLRAYDTASTPASSNDSLDDIVVTFSDRLAQEKNFETVQDNINRIAVAALQNYSVQFRQYQSNLASVYADAFNGGNPITIDEDVMNLWQTSAPSGTVPTFDASHYSRMGVEAEHQAIERVVPSGHFNLIIQSALSGRALDIYLTTTSGFAWAFPANPNCTTAVPGNCVRVQLGS